jgi:hypothetical protein
MRRFKHGADAASARLDGRAYAGRSGGDERRTVYYIEFVEKNDGVSQTEFQQVVRASNERWAAEHPDDELVMIIGRTWRLGPPPTYMVIWKIRDFAAFETWNAEFRKPRILENHGEFRAVGTIVHAGVYEDLGNEVL